MSHHCPSIQCHKDSAGAKAKIVSYCGSFFVGCFVFFLRRVRIARNADRCNSQSDSVRPSVGPSVTFRYFVQTNEAPGRKIILVSGLWRDIVYPDIRRGSRPANA